MKKLVWITTAVLTSQLVEAGHIKFWPDQKFPQEERVGTLPDHERVDLDMTKRWKEHDNRIRAMSFHWVTPGTRIQVFAHPQGSQNYDWVELEIKRWMPDYQMDTMEYASGLDNSKAWLRYHGTGKAERLTPGEAPMGVVRRKLTGLNGNVSHIKVFPGIPHDPPLEPRLHLCLQETYDFVKKHGAAEEWRDLGSWYRAWYPTVEVRGDETVKIHFKVEHVRENAADDRAIVKMYFDNDLTLTESDSDVTIGDDSVLTETSDQIWEDLPTGAKAEKYTIIARAASVTVGQLYENGAALFEKGGRKNFPNAIETVMVDYGEAISGCTADKYHNPGPTGIIVD